MKFTGYPRFHFGDNDDAVLSQVQSITDDHKLEFLKKRWSQNNIDEIESTTKTQSSHFEWFKY